MTFKVGDTVVYPHHGAALIEAIETRQIKGVDKTYLVLKVAQGDLTVRVPADNAEFVGVRDVVGQDGLDRVFEVLRAPYAEEPTNWSRRYKANLEKLASGDVIKVAEVVRDLWRRERERGLSAGEKRMLAKARQILVSELALAENTNEDKAEALLDEVLASRGASRGKQQPAPRSVQRTEMPRCPMTSLLSPGAAACSYPDLVLVRSPGGSPPVLACRARAAGSTGVTEGSGQGVAPGTVRPYPTRSSTQT